LNHSRLAPVPPRNLGLNLAFLAPDPYRNSCKNPLFLQSLSGTQVLIILFILQKSYEIIANAKVSKR